jgi:predicted site-specific integrase-resolvase
MGLCRPLQGWVITNEITEIGSGLNGKRKKLLILKVLQDETIPKPEFCGTPRSLNAVRF